MRNNQEIIDILKELKEQKGLSLSELARRVGIAKSALSRYFNGSREFPLNRIDTFASVLGVSVQYILGFEEKTEKSEQKSPINQLNQQNKEKALNYITNLLEEQNQHIEEPQALYNVDTVTQLSAGRGYSFDDYDVKTVKIAIEPPRCDLASIVNGDSMEPEYHDGDVVFLVDKGISTYNGQVCAVAVNDETYIKKVYTDKYGLRLVSLNPIYDDIFIDFPPAEDTHIKIYSVVGSAKVVR